MAVLVAVSLVLSNEKVDLDITMNTLPYTKQTQLLLLSRVQLLQISE